MMPETALSQEELAQLHALLARWRRARKSRRETRWDFNLAEGQLAESAFAEMARSIEIKRDFRWRETGRLFIETGSIGPDGEELEAGLSKSEASHVVFVLDGGGECGLALIVERERLLNLARAHGVKKRGPEKSVGYVVPVEVLLDAFRKAD